MFSYAKDRLESAEVLPGRRYHEDGAKIIRELSKYGFLPEDNYYRLVGVDTGNKLLETDIFAFHFNSRRITFQSPMMRHFCEGHRALWKVD
jgi:hypothetical protein